jgi:hypothetical protein
LPAGFCVVNGRELPQELRSLVRAMGNNARLRLYASVPFGMIIRRGRMEERCEKGNPAVRRVSAKPRASGNNVSLLLRQPGYRTAVEL